MPHSKQDLQELELDTEPLFEIRIGRGNGFVDIHIIRNSEICSTFRVLAVDKSLAAV